VWKVARKLNLDPEMILDFSSNINDFIGRTQIYSDSDISSYLEPLAKFLNISVSRITLGAGLTYFIHRFPSWYSTERSLIVTPTFGEYIHSASVYTKKYRTISFDELLMNLEGILKDFRPQSIYLTRPESTTGNLYDANEVRKVIQISLESGCKVFIDEAFIEFVGNWREKSLIYEVDEFSNLYVGRSLSKILGNPNLRAGYIISDDKNSRELQARMEPWLLSQRDLETIRDFDFSILESLPDRVKMCRDYLIDSMEKLGFKHLGNPMANYVTFKVPRGLSIDMVEAWLESRGIMIRNLRDYPELGDGYFRLAVRKIETEKILIDSLKELMEKSASAAGGEGLDL